MSSNNVSNYITNVELISIVLYMRCISAWYHVPIQQASTSLSNAHTSQYHFIYLLILTYSQDTSFFILRIRSLWFTNYVAIWAPNPSPYIVSSLFESDCNILGSTFWDKLMSNLQIVPSPHSPVVKRWLRHWVKSIILQHPHDICPSIFYPQAMNVKY